MDFIQRGRGHEPESKTKQTKQSQALGHFSENICEIAAVSTDRMPHHPKIHHSQQVVVAWSWYANFNFF